MRVIFIAFLATLAAGIYIAHQPLIVVPHELVSVFVTLAIVFGAMNVRRPSGAL